MGLTLLYSFRNIWVRRRTTFATLMGIALVIFVLVAVLMLADGINKTLADTGEADNALIVRKGANYETISVITRNSAQIISTHAAIATDTEGKAKAAPEIMVLINLPKRGDGQTSNATIRGVSPFSMPIRGSLTITEGRMFQQGTNEIIVGTSIQKNFRNCDVGGQLEFSGAIWQIVGVFDAKGAGFQSEIWGDAEMMMQSFRREAYSSMTVKLSDPSQFETLKADLESDNRLQVDVHREREFYAAQSAGLAQFIKILGFAVTFIFGIGAVVGAVITMYGTVSQRTREIGTLRALGFSKFRILFTFLFEALAISVGGAVLGVLLASFLSSLRFSTTNFTTFSELDFGFTLQPGTIVVAIGFSVVMGFAGGFLPAVRASRLNIVDALRNV
ncbi:MAG: ABC transporter permease [Acidobacteria bacterium]|nr:ABC transporter permease [Acidobacteriota bacterium]MCB9396639.1 ABC transporter permease [Acidobacteriota bacterium]